jgi:peptide/nickel transport system substrate-binding protein
VLLDKSSGLHPHAVRLHARQRARARSRPPARSRSSLTTDKVFAPTLRAELPDGQRGARSWTCSSSSPTEVDGDLGNGWLKTQYAGSGPLKVREWRANEVVALERDDNYNGTKSIMAPRHLPAPEGAGHAAPAAGEG